MNALLCLLSGLGSVASPSQPLAASPPPIALSRGMTKLLLSEDFTDSARFGFDGRMTVGQTFCQTSPGNIYGCSLDDPEGFVFSQEGLMIQNQTGNDFQAHIVSYDPWNQRGFLLPAGGGWYASLEVRLLSSWVGWPGGFAFWTLDWRHPYAGFAGVPTLDEPSMLEPDFHEIGADAGVRKEWLALHNWVAAGGGVEYEPSERSIGALRLDPERWFQCGALIEPDLSAYRWVVSNTVVVSRSPAWLSKFSMFRGAIMIGSGPNLPIQVKNLRVWGRP